VREIDINKDNKEIAEKAFNTASNAPFTVEDARGYTSIFVVTEKTQPVAKVKLAVIEREVVPTKQTRSDILQAASKFCEDAKSVGADKMAAKAQESGYLLIPATYIDQNAPRLGNIKNSRDIIRWAFDNKVNSVSDVEECDNKFVVAGVTRKNKRGYRTLEEVQPSLEAELRRDKKFELMKGTLEGKTIEQLQAENLTTDTVRNLAFGSMSAGSLGNDAAAIFALAPVAEPNKISAPIKGNNGAYTFEVLQKNENPYPFDAKQEIFRMNMQNQYSFQYIIEALKKAADVRDERFKFY